MTKITNDSSNKIKKGEKKKCYLRMNAAETSCNFKSVSKNDRMNHLTYSGDSIDNKTIPLKNSFRVVV
jgi:ribosomal protein L9